jgi:serine/threonine protein kinase
MYVHTLHVNTSSTCTCACSSAYVEICNRFVSAEFANLNTRERACSSLEWLYRNGSPNALKPTKLGSHCRYLSSSQVLCVASTEADGSAAVSAKISDFGLALRAMPLPSGRGWAPVRTPPRGTPLYMAPELLKEKDTQGCVEASRKEKADGVAVCHASRAR